MLIGRDLQLRRVGDDRIAERAETADLDLADIAGLHPRAAGGSLRIIRPRYMARRRFQRAGRSHDDDIAGLERVAGREVVDDLLDRKKHFVERLILLLDAIEARDQAMLLRIAEFVRGHEPRTEAARALEILSQAELTIMALELADRALIVAGIAGDMAQCLVHGNMAPGCANDDSELAFIVEGLGDLGIGTPERLVMADDADRHALEDLRMVWRGGKAGLIDMHLKIERQGPGRVRLGDDRIEMNLVEP